VFAQCEDPYECSVQVGDDSECSFQVFCDNTIIFYADASGAQQHCFDKAGTCYVPPTSVSSSNQGDRSTRALLRGGDR
jgi:hypothetical protein